MEGSKSATEKMVGYIERMKALLLEAHLDGVELTCTTKMPTVEQAAQPLPEGYRPVSINMEPPREQFYCLHLPHHCDVTAHALVQYIDGKQTGLIYNPVTAPKVKKD